MGWCTRQLIATLVTVLAISQVNDLSSNSIIQYSSAIISVWQFDVADLNLLF